MAIFASGDPDPKPEPTPPNPPLDIRPDAPQPAAIVNTYTPQAQADAAAIDKAYGG